MGWWLAWKYFCGISRGLLSKSCRTLFFCFFSLGKQKKKLLISFFLGRGTLMEMIFTGGDLLASSVSISLFASVFFDPSSKDDVNLSTISGLYDPGAYLTWMITNMSILLHSTEAVLESANAKWWEEMIQSARDHHERNHRRCTICRHPGCICLQLPQYNEDHQIHYFRNENKEPSNSQMPASGEVIRYVPIRRFVQGIV